MYRDFFIAQSHIENNCVIWDGKASERVGPIFTQGGKAHSVRRTIYRDMYGFEPDGRLKAINGRCHWRCINLQHFTIEYWERNNAG